jgi:membrane protease YdiL (CAAX protease family)
MPDITKAIKNNSMLSFFVLAFLFTWINWIPQALLSRGIVNYKVPVFITIIAGYGPALSAIIITRLTSGMAGVKNLFGRVIQWRAGLRWYAIVLLLPPAITIAAQLLHQLLGNGSEKLLPFQLLNLGPPGTPVSVQILLLAIVFIIGFDGFGEELGWRGFALPRLLEKYSALTASLVLGAIWAIWHLPYAMTVGTSMSEHHFLYFVPGIIASSILSTWIYNNTNGSILMVILFHATGNLSYMVLPVFFHGVGSVGILTTVIQWVIVIAVLLVEGPKYLSRSRLKKDISSG